jgi:hypothetical protein
MQYRDERDIDRRLLNRVGGLRTAEQPYRFQPSVRRRIITGSLRPGCTTIIAAPVCWVYAAPPIPMSACSAKRQRNLVRLRVAEIQQHPVAHVVGDKAVEARDRLGDAAVIGADDLAQVLGIQATLGLANRGSTSAQGSNQVE